MSLAQGSCTSLPRAFARRALLGAALALSACQPRTVGDEVAQSAPVSPCQPVLFEDSALTHCIADPARHAIRTALADREGAPYRSLAAYAQSRPSTAPPVAFAMNGGMYEAGGQPVGYYVEQGERLQRLNRAQGPGNFHLLPNGVFFGDERGGWHVLAADAFARDVASRPAFGTQSGPMLVVDGELHPSLDPDGASRKIRNAVGVDRQGRAHFVISEAPLSFGKLARYYRDVLKTPNALFLDGSVSQLWDPAHGLIDGGAPLGPLIVVEVAQNAPAQP